jgi:hypothetical protein
MIDAYEYWIDQDYSSSQLIEILPVETLQLNENITTGSLPVGIHKFSIRFRDTDGVWSGVMERSFTVLPTTPQSNSIITAEFWIDNDYSQAQSITISPGETVIIDQLLDLSSISPGFHLIGIHFIDQFGNVSPPFVRSFYKSGDAVNTADLTEYRYWYNDDFENLRSVSLSTTDDPYLLIEDLETDGIPFGAGQKFSLQFKNSNMLWSNVFEAEFEKILGCAPDINGDFEINTGDLTAILGQFGCSGDCLFGDLNMDGAVNSGDLVTLLGVFGTNCLE